MRIKIILVALMLFGVFISNESVAQRVTEQSVDGTVYGVIDCSALPEGSVKTPQELIDSKTTGGRVRRHLQATQTGELIPGIHGGYYANQKVSRKFAVMLSDLGYTGGWAGASGWAVSANEESDGSSGIANTGCAAYRGKNGTDAEGLWRLPTQRELMIIYAHKGQLERVTGFVPFISVHYWPATEGAAYGTWHVNFNNGYVHYSDYKSTENYVRCVRDL